ncbi:MAG: hypothetical protein PUK40_02085 [Actinomycetaceae bacterium]|nr:hypothetical protein [Arcanobacterium sp.]MDD7504730.1 hypothetical protein [Actinomycetaceae bacterium]MDY6143095.1 hypothetical protein [Arcanobacterium sp.]
MRIENRALTLRSPIVYVPGDDSTLSGDFPSSTRFCRSRRSVTDYLNRGEVCDVFIPRLREGSEGDVATFIEAGATRLMLAQIDDVWSLFSQLNEHTPRVYYAVSQMDQWGSVLTVSASALCDSFAESLDPTHISIALSMRKLLQPLSCERDGADAIIQLASLIASHPQLAHRAFPREAQLLGFQRVRDKETQEQYIRYQKLQRKYDALAGSKLGRLTMKWWDFHRKIAARR